MRDGGTRSTRRWRRVVEVVRRLPLNKCDRSPKLVAKLYNLRAARLPRSECLARGAQAVFVASTGAGQLYYINFQIHVDKPRSFRKIREVIHPL